MMVDTALKKLKFFSGTFTKHSLINYIERLEYYQKNFNRRKDIIENDRIMARLESLAPMMTDILLRSGKQLDAINLK